MSNQTHNITVDKELRRDTDAIIQRLKTEAGYGGKSYVTDSNGPNWRPSPEREEAIKKLKEAVMWLGMDLKAINDENPGAVADPYPNSKDPSNTVIDKTADGLKL